MEAKVNHLQRCLDGIYKVIRNANDILCGISQPSVCSEVLQSPQGVAYISELFSEKDHLNLLVQNLSLHTLISVARLGGSDDYLLHLCLQDNTGVNEVYKVAKRVEGGMKELSIDNEKLHNCLRDIELIWNNLQAFLSLSPSVLQMLSSELTPDCSAVTDSANGQNETCGVCLLRTANELNGKVNSVLYNSCHYHASCANFWLNCVDSNLPGLIAAEGRSQALDQASLAVPANELHGHQL